MSLVLICADLVLQNSLASVTLTSHRRREEKAREGKRAMEIARETCDGAAAESDCITIIEKKQCLTSASMLISEKLKPNTTVLLCFVKKTSVNTLLKIA